VRRCLLYLVTAALLTTANAESADTLYVRSIRTVDMCSAEQSALIVLDLGRVFASDSLLLFDITIGYNPRQFQPTSILASGTLSERLTFGGGPFMNLTIPGEIRLNGFDVSRPAFGDRPLVAFNGTLLADGCNSTVELSIPYRPEFNEEFKKQVEVLAIDTIRKEFRPRPNSSNGGSFVEDTIRISDKEQTASIQTEILVSTNSTVTATFELDQGAKVEIDTITSSDVEILRQSRNDKEYAVTFTGQQSVSTLTCTVGSNDTNRRTTAMGILRVTVKYEDCTCEIPAKIDSCIVVAQAKHLDTTTKVGVDENPVAISVSNNSIAFQSSHEHLQSIECYTILGNKVWTYTENMNYDQCPITDTNNSRSSEHYTRHYSLKTLHEGLYIVIVQTNRGRHVLKLKI